MTAPAPWSTPGLRSRLVRLESPALVDRYRMALQRATGREVAARSFSIDAAGFSPELADELGDLHYLGHGPCHPCFLLVSVDQLDAPLLQPNAGMARSVYQGWIRSQRRALADLTVEEPVWGEFGHGVTRFLHPGQLGMVRSLSLSIHTPSERLAAATRFARLRQELMTEASLWSDEDFLARMREAARQARRWPEVPAELVDGYRVPVGPSFVPEFGGTWIWPGRSRHEPRAWVFCGRREPTGEASWRSLADEAGVELLRLDPGTVVDFLVVRGLAVPSFIPGPETMVELERVMDWVALDHLGRAGRLGPEAQAEPRRAMQREPELPSDYLELDQLRLRLQDAEDPLEFAGWSAMTRLRMLSFGTAEPEARAWVEHLRSELDPAVLPRRVEHAPDRLAASVEHLPAELVARYLAECERVCPVGTGVGGGVGKAGVPRPGPGTGG